MSCILGDVAHFTKSLNFTFLITVSNLGLAKIQFWLVPRQNKELKNNNLLLFICTKPFPLTKNEEKLFLVNKSSGLLLGRLLFERSGYRVYLIHC